MMTNETLISDTARIQRLTQLLPMDEITTAVLSQILELGLNYADYNSYNITKYERMYHMTAVFVKICYSFGCILYSDATLLAKFTRISFWWDKGTQDTKYSGIMEAVLIYAMNAKRRGEGPRRQRKRAAKIGPLLEGFYKENASPDDVISRLEAAGGIDKLY
jgi:hypothetical protein